MVDAAIICSFSVGLDELPRKQQRDMRAVARVLAQAGRFSVFDATANRDIARTMDRLVVSDWFVFDHEGVGYPWTSVTLTDAGRAALADPPRPGADACEWNPGEGRPAQEGEFHAWAVWSVGKLKNWHLCEACAALPEFKRMRYRVRMGSKGEGK